MAKLRAFLMAGDVALDEGATSCWFHVLMEGSWEGHPSGAFEIDESTIDAMISRFAMAKTPMLVDWYHRSIDPRSVDDGKAAGFATKLEKRHAEDGTAELWAYGEWNATAVEMLRSGEIRYCSPVIDWEAEDRKTADVGVELFNIALTNQPFLDGQHAIQLHRLTRTGDPKMTKKKITALAEEAPADEAPKNEETPGNAPDNMADMVAAMELLADASGLSSAETIKAIVGMADKIAAMISGNTSAEDAMVEDEDATAAALSAVTSELEDARAQVVSLQAALKAGAKSAEQELEEMIACGRVKESRRDGALALLKSDRALFSRVWPEGVQEAPLGGQTTRGGEEAASAAAVSRSLGGLTAAQRATYEHLTRMSRGGQRTYTDAEALERTLKHTAKDQPTA